MAQLIYKVGCLKQAAILQFLNFFPISSISFLMSERTSGVSPVIFRGKMEIKCVNRGGIAGSVVDQAGHWFQSFAMLLCHQIALVEETL